jgi:uncharacterized protein (UPF0548 family)
MRQLLAEQVKLDFTYAAVGATGGTPPSGFAVDHTRIELGMGEAVFLAAKAALQRWEEFQLGWVEAWPRDARLQTGAVVAVRARSVGLWWLNCCRIVYTVDEAAPLSKFGFAYGTLPHHVECGEERLLIEWDRDTNLVCYDIIAFSRPHHFLTRLGYPAVRRIQKRFGRDSCAALFRAVNPSAPLPAISQDAG